MKHSQSRLFSITLFVLFPLLMLFRRGNKVAYTCILLLLFSLSSCYLNYYSTNTMTNIDARTMNRLKTEKKDFIIHFFNATYGLEDISLDGETLNGKLVPLTDAQLKYLHPKSVTKNRYKKKDQYSVLMEVHLYTNANNKEGNNVLSTSLTSFNRSDIYEFNEGATRRNHIMSTVGIVATAVGAALFIVAAVSIASTCNCPQVYMDSAGTYSFASGLYSGAVYSTLERTDYLPLNNIPANARNISFKISNAKNEEQFINNVQLLHIRHLLDVHVLTDRHGHIFSYGNVTSLSSAITNGNDNAVNALSRTDEIYYSFDNNENSKGLSDLVIKFKKPANTTKAKLVIHARNTYWSGLLHKEFLSLFGDNFEKWKEKQEKADPKELEKWQTDQALPLMVYVKTSAGWKFIDYFPLIGNTASRDMIMEIKTDEINDDNVELKLETSYRFWDIDFAGIDYTPNNILSKNIIEPEKAAISDSSDERNALRVSDKQYVHLTDEESVYFKYVIPESPDNNISSYFLVSAGYYHNLEKIYGKSNIAELYKFKKKGAFDDFSRKKYKEAMQVAVVIGKMR